MTAPTPSGAHKLQLIIDQVDRLPTLPAVAAKVLSLAASEGTNARDISRIIEGDPSLTARILSLVNSARFGGSQNVSTIDRAVTLLGFETIRNSVLSLKVFDLMEGTVDATADDSGTSAAPATAAAAFDRPAFWKHSLAVAAASQMLAQHVRGISDSEAFVAGLLHDLGKVALHCVLPRTFDQVARRAAEGQAAYIDVEGRILGLNHAVIGKRLLSAWGFPAALVNVAWMHHQAPAQMPEKLPGRTLVLIVHLADVIARRQRIGLGSPVWGNDESQALAAALGLQPSALESVDRRLHQAVADQSRVMGLESGDASQLLNESLRNANVQLGQINDRLLMQSARVQRQKRLNDTLLAIACGDGGSSEQPGGSHLLGLLAERMAAWLGSRALAVCVSQGDELAIDVALRLDNGATDFVSVESRSGHDGHLASAQIGDNGFGLSRAEKREAWLFERLGQRMGQGPFWALDLSRRGQRFGTVVFSLQGNEAAAEVLSRDSQELISLAEVAAVALERRRNAFERENLMEELNEAGRLASTAQQELYARRSLASVGEMAAGAAHEINNPLAVISGRAQLLIEDEQDESRAKALQIIVDQAQRASGIINEMMYFARPASPAKTPVDVPALLAEAVAAQAQTLAEKQVQLIHQDNASPDEVPDAIPQASVDRKQVLWCLEELIRNAAAEMTTPGQITLSARHDEESNRLLLLVADNGPGMTAEVEENALAPFFSGRRAGRGRGMGLPKVQRIMESHGGRMRIMTAPGQGTTVELALPIS